MVPLVHPESRQVCSQGMFVVFTVLWLAAGRSRWRYAGVAGAGIALAALTEIVQTFPGIGRHGCVADFLTDLLGLAAGMAIGAAPTVEFAVAPPGISLDRLTAR